MKALLAYHKGDLEAEYVVERDDGFSQRVPAAIHFDNTKFSEIEHKALELSYGRILDVGACAGRHSLALIERGYDVTSLDVEADCEVILKARGLENILIKDIMKFEEQRFDTLLMLMNGIGMVGTIEVLDRFLAKIPKLLQPNGQLLCDSVDVTVTNNPVHVSYREENTKAGRAIGQQFFRISFNDVSDQTFPWLHLTPDSLKLHCEKAGLNFELVFKQSNGSYLARIRL